MCCGLGVTLILNVASLFSSGALNLGAVLTIRKARFDEGSVMPLVWGAGLRAVSLDDEKERRNFEVLSAVWRLPGDSDECAVGSSMATMFTWATDKNPALFLTWRLLGRHYSCEGGTEEGLRALQQAGFPWIVGRPTFLVSTIAWRAQRIRGSAPMPRSPLSD